MTDTKNAESCANPMPCILHYKSIVTPSLLHRNDGLSMDNRWIIFGVLRVFVLWKEGKV